jgi:hydroxypyruvate reductase
VIDRPPDALLDRPSEAPPCGRALLTELYDAAVAGAAPGPLTTAALRDFECRPEQRIWLFAFGKASHAMATAAVGALQRSLHTITAGVIVGPEALPSPYTTITTLAGDHPLPGRNSFAAAQRIGELAAGMRSDDVAIVLISGGATSLIGAPLKGLAEPDLVHLYELLHESGLDIREMNAVRKRFTRWGAGRFALALAPARTHTFIISDVAGDDPADIASGPCTPDASTVQQVMALLQRAALLPRIAPSMREYLNGVLRGTNPETPRATHPAFAHVSSRVIGSNRLATSAAAARAESLGLQTLLAPAAIDGDAAACGAAIAAAAVERARAGWRGCMIWGGETTVQLAPTTDAAAALASTASSSANPARGGRCQELALSASRVLAESGEDGGRVTLLAAGTDGRDGPTDAAGAFADASIWQRVRERGHDPSAALARHDSHTVLDAAEALHRRGHTGTNVMDVVIAVVD